MKKIVVSILAIVIIPVISCFISVLFQKVNCTDIILLILYSILIFAGSFYLFTKKIRLTDWILALIIGFVTVTYTVPLRYIGIVAGLATSCVFLVCREILPKQCSCFAWVRTGIRYNIKVFGGITLLYALITTLRYTGSFTFSPLSPFLALKACAPAISEELIFRLFFPVLLFKLLNLENSTSNKVWVFIVITIPYALLHCTEMFVANDVSRVVSYSYTIMINSLIHAFLISRYGFVYGVYSHALSDFIAMSLV